MTTVLVGSDVAELGDRAARLERRMSVEAGSLLRDPPSGWIVGTVQRAAEQLRALATRASTASSASTCSTMIWTRSR